MPTKISFVFANKIVNKDELLSLLIKNPQFKTINKLQLKNTEKKNPRNEPSVLSAPLKYPSSWKYKINFLYSPVIKINENNTGPAK